ncbi:uncharacterized protein LOC113129594 [Mastacembelus armatus]|uniref:uncharacterized protein LOC113129594 n=1 Tax=Mastacembelus armatus TaxID=205130 RepID=UPI000E45F3DA|nr:uncharacterized protein LOC113129594 [Mastacembelus armatus]
MGQCLSSRLQALEGKWRNVAGAGTSPPHVPGSSLPPLAPPSSPHPLTVAAIEAQSGPSTDLSEGLRELEEAEVSEDDTPTAVALRQQGGSDTPPSGARAAAQAQLTRADATPTPCTPLPKVATSLEDLDPALASALEAHLSTALSHKDKLSALQLAFFSYRFEQLAINDTKDLKLKAAWILRDGVEANIWRSSWTPQGAASLQDFLAEKMKTTLKKRRVPHLKEELRKSAKRTKKSGDDSEGQGPRAPEVKISTMCSVVFVVTFPVLALTFERPCVVP